MGDCQLERGVFCNEVGFLRRLWQLGFGLWLDVRAGVSGADLVDQQAIASVLPDIVVAGRLSCGC